MKQKLLILVLCCSALTGCSTSEMQNSRISIENLQSSTAVESTSTKPINVESTAEKLPNDTVSPLGMVSAKVTNGPSYSFDEDPVKISYAYSIEGDIPDFGLIVLCDGIAVPFSTELNTEQSVLQVIPYTKSGETKNVDLYITPIGKKGDSVSIQIVDILDPEYDISTIDYDSENAFQPFIVGGRLRINSLSGLHIAMKQDGLPKPTSVSTASIIEDIPEDVINSNQSVREDGTIDNQLRFLKSYYTDNLHVVVNHGEMLPIDTKLSGTAGQNLFVSFYLDNKLMPVWDGCDYLQCYIDDKHYTQIKGELDTSKLEKGRYLCYTVCGNTEYNNCTAPIHAFILEVI